VVAPPPKKKNTTRLDLRGEKKNSYPWKESNPGRLAYSKSLYRFCFRHC